MKSAKKTIKNKQTTPTKSVHEEYIHIIETEQNKQAK